MNKTILSIVAVMVIIISFKLCLEANIDRPTNRIEQLKQSDMKTNMTHKTIPLQGTEIHYYSNNKRNAETIIFLHPAFSDHTCFNNQIDFFSEHFNIITVDLLGHGQSSVGKSKDKIDQTYKHLNQILISENITKAHIVGVSMGSLLAQDFAMKFPLKVQSLTALGGYDINTIYPEINKGQSKEIFNWLFKALFSMDSFRKYTASVSVINEEEQVNFYNSTKGFARKSFMVMSSLGNIISERNNNTLSYPLLIMSGDKDNKLALQVANKWHKKQSESKLCIIKDAGHCANMDAPIEFNKTVLNFLTNK